MYRGSWGRDFRRGTTLSLGDVGGVFSVLVAVLVPLLGLMLFLRRRRLADADSSARLGWREQTKRGYKAFFGTIGVGILFASVSAALLSGPELPVYGIAALVALLALPFILVFALDLGTTADEDGWRRRTRRGFTRLFCSIGILAYVGLALAVLFYERDTAGPAIALPEAVPQRAPSEVVPNAAQGNLEITPHSCPSGFVFVEAGTIAANNPAAGTGNPTPAAAPALTLARSICVQATEVTQGQWERAMGNNPSFFSACGDDCPVDQVSWFDAVEYANARSRQEGLPACYDGFYFVGAGCTGYRLPTSDEWTYAAQGGVAAAPIADLDAVSWNPKNSDKKPHPTRSRQPNRLGLYDTLGGVWEWTQDEYDIWGTPQLGKGDSETARILRGGSWYTLPEEAPAAASIYNFPDRKLFHVGFRLVKTWTDNPTESNNGREDEPDPMLAEGSGSCPIGYALIEPSPFATRDEMDWHVWNADPVHWSFEVNLQQRFCLKKTEVTQGEWTTLMGSNPSQFRHCGPSCPVEQVSWLDAVRFADALNGRAGLRSCYGGNSLSSTGCRGFRLPTEAEWEFAAYAPYDRSTAGTLPGPRGFRNSPELNDISWYSGNSGVSYEGGFDCADWTERAQAATTCGTHLVGTRLPNRLGLSDMLGNVWEWTSDWYEPTPYAGGPALDPLGPRGGNRKVLRGASWNYPAEGVRARIRQGAAPQSNNAFTGFRLAIAARPVGAARTQGNTNGSGSGATAPSAPAAEQSTAPKTDAGENIDTTTSYPDLINLVDADLPACLGPSALCPAFSGSGVRLDFSLGAGAERKSYIAAYDYNNTSDADPGAFEYGYNSSAAFAVFEIAHRGGRRSFVQRLEGSCGFRGYPCDLSLLPLSDKAMGVMTYGTWGQEGLFREYSTLIIIGNGVATSISFSTSGSNVGAVVCESDGSDDYAVHRDFFEYETELKLEPGDNPDFPDILIFEEQTITPCNGDAEVTRQTLRFRYSEGGYGGGGEPLFDGW